MKKTPSNMLQGLKVILFLFATAVACAFSSKAKAQCIINMSGADLQMIDGFGAFSAWSGPISSEQGEILFGTGNGQLGMSLFRCYIDEKREWAEARGHAQLAHSYGVKVLGSSWSPPYSMKSNNANVGGYLLRSNYGAFASYLAEAAQAINVDYVSFQNEPDYDAPWGGCRWSSADLETWCQNNAPTVGKPIVMAESASFTHSLTDPTLNNSKAAANVAIIGGHLYGTSPSLYQKALDRDKPVWMTEHCSEENDFNAAMNTAQEISDCMNCQMSAYIWWWINSNQKSSFINGNTIDSRGYVFAQFSRFIRPGSRRVEATYSPQPGIFVTAYRVNGGCAIVAFNRSTNPVRQLFNIQNGTATTLQGYQTSASQSVADIGNFSVVDGNFSTTLPPQSVTTFIQSTTPTIAHQPQSTSINPGAYTTFSVAATGVRLKYQWYFNETTVLAGANSSVLTLTGTQANRIGYYSVVVSNETGSITSTAARLSMSPLVWGKPVTISNATDISTTGTLLYAYSNSDSDATVNGVSFTGVNNFGTWGTGVTLAGFNASLSSTFKGESTLPWSGLDAGYQKILGGAAFNWGSGAATVTLNNLVAGNQYLVQVWVNDSRAGGSAFRTETVTGANTVTLAVNSNQIRDGLGQYVIGNFTATGRTQSFTINGGSNPPQINAIQIRDVSAFGKITWGMPTTISSEVDVSTNGLLLYAYNNSGSNATVNGVSFTGVNNANNWGVGVTLSGFNGSLTSIFGGGSATPWTHLDSSYKTILQGGAFNWMRGAGTVTLNNLTVGRQYQVQVWVNDSREGGSANRAEALSGDNIVTMAFNSTQTQGGLGQYTVGSFFAVAATQSFNVNGGTGPPQINALQIRDITGAFATSLPVTNGLVMRMDASQVTCADGSQLNAWMDTSGAANHALRQNGSSTGYPKYIASGINRMPVVRFNSSGATGDGFKFPRISNIKTVFWVIKENADLNAEHFLLGDDSTYQFHRSSANGPLWSETYTSPNIKNGITKLMGNVVDGTKQPLPAESFQLVSLVTAGDVQANQICQDRTSHGSWQGDIAEILIYNRAVTGVEEDQIGSYLAAKYALPTLYAGSKAPAVPSGVLAAAVSPGAIGVSWPAVSSAVSYNIWYKPSAGGLERVITGVTASPYTVTGFTTGVSYDFKIAAINAIKTSNYSVVSKASSLASSAKNILTFIFPGEPNAVISENSIIVTLPYGTNVNALAPIYTLSSDATGSPSSGTPKNFSVPQNYIISAPDGSTKTYTVSVRLAPSPLVYNFDDGTLQGWYNRVWNGRVWIDLINSPNAFVGTLLPVANTNGLFVPGNNAVWVSGHTDYHLNTLWLRSPQFYLNGTSNLTVDLAKGIEKTIAPVNDLVVPFATISDGGWKGVALRRVRDGVFVLSKPRTGVPGDAYRTVTFTREEMSTLDLREAYTLDLINSDNGSWGWLTMDNVVIPGTPVAGILSTTTSVTSSLNPAPLGAGVTFTATVSGRTPSGNVSFYAGTNLLGTVALNTSYRASITTSNLTLGDSIITASYLGSTNNPGSSSPAMSQKIAATSFDAWITGSTLGVALSDNIEAMDDPDKDGIPNVLEFVLGGAPMVHSQAPLPTLAKSDDQLVFTYYRSKAAQNSISQIVEYGNNLGDWTPVEIPAQSLGNVTITVGEFSDKVSVTIPNEGRQTFFRLKVVK